MSTHLSQEEIVLSYYGDAAGDAARVHLDACAECRAELAHVAQVLDRITPVEVPEPAGDYEARVWDRLSWRLRSEKRAPRAWPKWLAAAAMFALAFLAGLIVNRREIAPTPHVSPKNTTQVAGSTEQQRDRILLVVVGDHFDESERVLVELTNLTPDGETDITTERERAEELLASNRIYRRTALDRGEESVATLLDELEPVLMQIAHAPSNLPADELRRIQKRVEAKGLVFKLRVVRADVRATSVPHLQQPTI